MSASVSLSASAADRIKAILADQPRDNVLRVSVEGGGCSGFSYKFDFDTEISESDFIAERDGAKVVIDDMSLDLLKGSQIDYVDELIGASFRINNPNATASCGCGTSFSL